VISLSNALALARLRLREWTLKSLTDETFNILQDSGSPISRDQVFKEVRRSEASMAAIYRECPDLFA
jgi:hypothetical protein